MSGTCRWRATVVAIGNACGYDHTVTVGVVSAVGRDVTLNREVRYRALIQTDASINPGNSGGQLAVLESPHLAQLAELPLDREAAEFSERLRRRFGKGLSAGAGVMLREDAVARSAGFPTRKTVRSVSIAVDGGSTPSACRPNPARSTPCRSYLPRASRRASWQRTSPRSS